VRRGSSEPNAATAEALASQYLGAVTENAHCRGGAGAKPGPDDRQARGRNLPSDRLCRQTSELGREVGEAQARSPAGVRAARSGRPKGVASIRSIILAAARDETGSPLTRRATGGKVYCVPA
jgi:hypothetical protein